MRDRGGRHRRRSTACESFEATIRGGPGDGPLYDDFGTIDRPNWALARAAGPRTPVVNHIAELHFLAMYDRKTRETVLLRADADALACGTVSWQASDDATDVDYFTAAGEGTPPPNRPRDLQLQWVHFWGPNHMSGRMTGPRETRSTPSVRFWEKLRPGRVEPVDLLLNPDYHPDRERLNVGAKLGWLGTTPRANRYGRQRN